MDTSPTELVPPTPAVFQLLLVLSAGEAHGAIMQEVARGEVYDSAARWKLAGFD